MVSQLFGWKDQGMVIDTMAHLGSLFAFFYTFVLTDLKDYTDNGFFQFSETVFDTQLVKKIVIATTPAIIIGLLFRDVIANYARNAEIISITTIFFAIVLFIADQNEGAKKSTSCHIKEAFLIGLAQSIALIPGVSRSGITLAAGLFFGFLGWMP